MSADYIDDDTVPTTLDGLVEYRDFIYSTLTKEIIQLFSERLNEALIDFIPNSPEIDWNTIEKIVSLPKYVRMVGISSPVLGSIAMVDGNKITITEENSRRFKNLVRFIFPVKLLEEGSVSQIASYIKDITYISSIVSERDIENLLMNYDFTRNTPLHDVDGYAKLLDRATKPKEIMGFSTDFLSDEHIKSLFLATDLVSETKN